MPPEASRGVRPWVFLAVFVSIVGSAQAAVEGYRPAALEAWQVQPGMNGRQTWRQTGLVDYVYRLRVACHCALNGQSRVYVIEGKVARIEDMSGKARRLPDRLATRFTVPALFRFIDDAAAGHPDAMAWRLNRWLGYPEFIRVDPSHRMADDETDYRLDEFRRLLPVAPGPDRGCVRDNEGLDCPQGGRAGREQIE